MLLIKLTDSSDPDEIFFFLEEEGFEVLYSSETPEGEAEIYLESNDLERLSRYPFVVEIREVPREIDWENQWALHAKNFKEGFIHLDLAAARPPLLLKPGPGFGDLSHPTTELVLELMKPFVEGKSVLDIGCGSGILSLAASHLGAKEVLGIDIDPDAVRHARENGTLNALSNVHFSLPEEPLLETPMIRPQIGLMNMIFSEQRVAFKTAPRPDLLITSGIRVEEQEHYLEWLKSEGYLSELLKEQEGWLGIVAKKSP